MSQQPEPTSPTAEQLLQAILQQLGTLLGVAIQCAVCVTDARQGGNPNVNLANLIIDGTALCHAHVDLLNGRLVKRGVSGLLITGN